MDKCRSSSFCLPFRFCFLSLALLFMTPATVRADEPPVPPVVVLAAGDVAQCSVPGAAATATLLDHTPGTILALGDLAYPRGSAKDFERCYEPTWGRFKHRTLPAPGNHEYLTPDAQGYFDYFESRAGEPGKGYYSLDMDGWHIISLNSNIDAGPGSPQLEWLKADLAASRQACILAFWHHPRFSSGPHLNNKEMAPIWETLYEAGATLVLAGHDHDYERFAPLDGQGRPDETRGIRSFVVGTGGGRLYNISFRSAASEVWNGSTWGVLKLDLYPGRYTWTFLPAAGGDFHDSGEGNCVSRTGPNRAIP